MLKYSELTREQRDKITNGCGGKGSYIPIPNFIFKASCDQHDFYYWLGHSESDREKADNTFYHYMMIDVEEQSTSLIQYAFLASWAFIYYKAVRSAGSKYFSYNAEYKTIEDLEALEG